jgi:hypothetical protein
MNSILTTDAPFYFMAGIPLVGILLNVVQFVSLCRRIDRLANRADNISIGRDQE